tara:strand:- start:438 stop:710 length:273 start_codon:yes stop_codon:yes gene_type:complete
MEGFRKTMNYTFDKSKLSIQQLSGLEKNKKLILTFKPEMRKIKAYKLLYFWINQKGLNPNNKDEWNFILYYFMELGFSYSEILTAYLEMN